MRGGMDKNNGVASFVCVCMYVCFGVPHITYAVTLSHQMRNHTVRLVSKCLKMAKFKCLNH